MQIETDFMLARLTTARQPLDGVLELWFLDLDKILPLAPSAILSPGEEERARRFLLPRHALHYRNSHLLLRFALAWRLMLAPHAVSWHLTAHGKPMLSPETGLYFNLSHCDHFAVVAISNSGEVGVDIEPAARVTESDAIAERFFAPEEARWISEAVTPEAKDARFLRLWTRKEAVMKAIGTGMSDSLLAARVLDNMTPLPAADGQQTPWRVQDIPLPLPAIAAVAARDGRWDTRCLLIDAEDFVRMAEAWR